MSNRNKRQFKSSANIIFSKKINLFPDDFFSTFDKTNEGNSKNKNKFHPILPFKENQKTNSYNNCRNIDKNKTEDNNINNYTNVIKLDNNINIDFSFQGPPSPPSSNQKNKINNKKHSFSAINKNNSLKPLFQSPLSTKKANYELGKNNNNSKGKFRINYSEKRVKSNNNNSNELFKETKLKFSSHKNISNIKLGNNHNNIKKQKEIELEKNLENNFKRNINNNKLKIKKNIIYTDKNKDQDQEKEKEKEKSFNLASKRNRTNTNFYRPYTPLIKNKKMKKLVNIHKSREIVLKSSSSKPIKDKNSILDTEKKIKNKSKLIPHMNNFNKRAISLNNNKKNNGSNNINNEYSLNLNNKSNIQKKIRISINNLFKDLPKNCEDNPVIFNKFESLIKNMKNIQEIILKKKLSLYNNNNINHDNEKNLESEKI
jgi:hypothetical protein